MNAEETAVETYQKRMSWLEENVLKLVDHRERAASALSDMDERIDEMESDLERGLREVNEEKADGSDLADLDERIDRLRDDIESLESDVRDKADDSALDSLSNEFAGMKSDIVRTGEDLLHLAERLNSIELMGLGARLWWVLTGKIR